MRKSWGLRTRMFNGFLIAALIPVFLFAAASHMILQRRIDERMEERLTAAGYNTDQCFRLLIDKYDTVLQDFCMNTTIVEIVRKWETSGEISAGEREDLNRELSNICNRDEGIEGITLQLKNGRIYFYDYQTGSSEQTEWADRFEIPRVEQGNMCRGLSVFVEEDGESIHLFQIARDLDDSGSGEYSGNGEYSGVGENSGNGEYSGVGEYLGTVVLSLSETFVCDMLQSDEGTSVYLLDGDTVVCAEDETLVGTTLEQLKEGRDSRYTTVFHEESGMTICVELPMETYYEVSIMQFISLLLVAALTVFLIVTINFIVTEPSIETVTVLEEAISQVENGDFSTHIQIPKHAATELVRIGDGFNSMVNNIEHLIEENQRASMEQRNAELSALEAQIDPHFLYNTLDTINWKAIENGQYEISEMIVDLADILRYIVKNAAGVTTLNQELAWLEQYMRLQSLKLERIPTLEIIVSEDVMGCSIHKLLLQPFVENSIKYGFAEKEGECELLITAKFAGEQLHIMIEDNGCGVSAEILERLNDESREYEGHVGVSNVRKRLKLYYGEEAMVYFESVQGEYTRAHLFIPVTSGKDMI